MKLNTSTGACCFHDNGLCSIQAELGESYLSPTCATYPRNINEVNGQQEASAVLSCPEVARLAILNPKGIEFVYNDVLAFPNIQWNTRISTETPAGMPIAKHFWDLRIIAIEILQNRNFSLPHRFMQLAVLADRIDELSGKDINEKIPGMLDQFRVELSQDQGIADRNLFPTNNHFQVRFLNDLLLTVVEKHLWHNVRYKDCLDQYLQGMQQAGSENTDRIIEYFEEVYNNYYLPFMAEHEYMLENYLVNYIFQSLFPLSGSGKMFEKVHYLGVLYSLLRMQLIGMSALNKGLNAELVIKLLQSFTKNFDHAHKFKQIINEKCRQEQMMTLGHLSLLVMT
jgi:lysine-N-methylase